MLLQEDNQCELNNLCVLPDYRHNNIGVALLKDAYVRAKNKGCVKINIGIVEENRVLRKWYEVNCFIHTDYSFRELEVPFILRQRHVPLGNAPLRCHMLAYREIAF